MFILLIFLLNRVSCSDNTHWGTYKPNRIFHYMQKTGINMGFMYSKPANQIPLTMYYSNKQFYSTYHVHDFNGTVHSSLTDERADFQADFKIINRFDKDNIYLLLDFQQGFLSNNERDTVDAPLEIVLYFYHANLPLSVDQTKDQIKIKFKDEQITIPLHSLKNCIINKQTLQWNQEELWKTDFIYEYKTSKNFDFDKGINTLSKKTPQHNQNSKKPKKQIRSQSIDFDDEFDYSLDDPQHSYIDKSHLMCLNVLPFHNYQCSDDESIEDTYAQLEAHYHQVNILYFEREKEKLHNIAFVQICNFNKKSSIYLSYAPHSPPSFKPAVFHAQFEQRTQLFAQKVHQKFFPSDFSVFSQKLFYISKNSDRTSFTSFVPPNYELKSIKESFEKSLQRGISNLLGGIIYYQGSLERVDYIYDDVKEVFSATPSRTLFPRGFLWDDGFHLVPICHWDTDLCKQIIKNWLKLADKEGWIAREQARSEEITKDIPHRFISQDPSEANPPTLLLPILQIVKNIRKMISIYHELNEDDRVGMSQQIEKEIGYIREIYPMIKKWREWFENTQSHLEDEEDEQINEYRYRWKCKGGCEDGMFLGSGMDDYPRLEEGQYPKEHLDLHCWMIFFDNTLAEVGKVLSNEQEFAQDYKFFKEHAEEMIRDLYEKFLDGKDDLFKDRVKQREVRNGSHEFDNGCFNSYWKDTFHFQPGYVNLFPLFFGLINEKSQQWWSLKRYLTQSEKLWSNFGIRSLSAESPFYQKDENYWRGSVWLPINYMVLRGIRLYLKEIDSQQIYYRLRENLLINLYSNWEQSGYMFENYNDTSGLGQRGYPFDGWTTAVYLSISAELYD